MGDSLRNIALFPLALIISIGAAQAGPEQGASKALAAFTCGVYLEQKNIGDDPDKGKSTTDERKRLFELGYAAGLEFLTVAENNPKLFDDAPFTFRMMLGPNRDFILGRWFEYTVSDAHDEISKNVESKYKLDPSFRAIAAKDLYRKANCALLGK
jgi:hypothetical protein